MGDQLKALVSADQVVRFSDLANDDNYVLSLADVPGMDDKLTDKLVNLAHHRGKNMLAVGRADVPPRALLHLCGCYPHDANVPRPILGT